MSGGESHLNKYIGVMGYDKLSEGLIEFYKESCFGEPVWNDTKTINTFDYSVGMDVLNVCIPYKDIRFVGTVVREARRTKAKLTIIRSSVAPFTTKRIRNSLNNIRHGTKRAVVYSPIIGMQGIVRKYFKAFPQFIGFENYYDEKLVKDHFSFLGFRRIPVYLNPAVIVEINKLIDTTYTGVCMAYIDYVSDLCEIYDIPFSTFERYNRSVNSGYSRLSMSHFHRPALEPVKGKIKGSTIIADATLLNKCYKNKLVKSVLDLK